MKKAILSLLLALPFCQASAQYKVQFSPVEAPASYQLSRQHNAYVPTPLEDATIAHKTAGNPGPRWYNHAQALATYSGLTQAQLYSSRYTTDLLIWQDSSVRYSAPNNNIGITWMGVAEMFAPNTTLYNANTTANRGKLWLRNEPYRVDSVMIRGFYNRISGPTGYNDTLILTFVSDSTLGTFSWYSYSGSTLGNHGIDSFGALLWDADDYQKNPISQISYSTTPTGGGPTKYVRYRGQIKVPLTQATFVDSLADGSQLIKVPVGLNVPGTSVTTGPGGRISMSVAFKSGTNYTAGSPVTNYNYFAIMSHETDSAQFQFYPPTDLNMSYSVTKDSSKTYVGNGLNIYIPTIGFTSASLGAEVHDISWKVSCATCNTPVGVNDVVSNVSIGNVYPNPANNTINVPFSVTSAANVSVSISNLLGQVLKTNTFHVGAGQSKTAVFNSSDLANGIYIYTVESEGGRVANRFVVSH